MVDRQMTNDDRTTLAAVLVEMSRQLLAPNGEPFEVVIADAAVAEDQRESRLAVSVGLGRPDLKGALVVMARSAFFRATYPAAQPGQTVSAEDIADWAGEVGNQLLGRLKNQLCQLGLDFSVGVPIVFQGEGLHLRLSDGPNSLRCRLRVHHERVDLFLEVTRTDGAALLATGNRPATASLEGDVVLF